MRYHATDSFDSKKEIRIERGRERRGTGGLSRALEDAVIEEKKKWKKKKIAHFRVAYREAVLQWRRRLFGNGITSRRYRRARSASLPPFPREKNE